MHQALGTCTASITLEREGDESPTGYNALACRPLTVPSRQHSPDDAPMLMASGEISGANNRMSDSADINMSVRNAI